MPFIFLVAFGVYVRTLAPSITWKNNGGDSGDLVAAAFSGGIPHPPGYPFYTSLAELFIALPIGGVAYRVNLLSAVSAAATVVALYFVIHSLLDQNQVWRRAIVASSALFFAFSPLFWSQATFASVRGLTALLTITALGGFLMWAGGLGIAREQTDRRGMWIVAMALGLGIAHHPTILFVLPAGLVLLWKRERLRVIVGTLVLAAMIGGLVDLTLILRASADPPYSWGDPKTITDLWWLISGQVYHSDLLGLPVAAYPARFSAWAKILFDQFGYVGVALGLWGCVEFIRRHVRSGLALVITFGLYSVFSISYSTADSDAYLIPAYMVFAIWVGQALSVLVNEIVRRANPLYWVRPLTMPTLALGLLLLPVSNCVINFASVDQSRDTEALDYGRRVFAAIPENAAVVAYGNNHTLALWYYRYVERPNSRVMVVVPGLLSYTWYRAQLQRHNPEWLWPSSSVQQWDDFLQTLIQENQAARPIFSTDPDPHFQPADQYYPVGSLFRIVTTAKP